MNASLIPSWEPPPLPLPDRSPGRAATARELDADLVDFAFAPPLDSPLLVAFFAIFELSSLQLCTA
jgi:hypothetical protein